MKKTIISIIVTVAVVLAIGSIASGATNNLPKGVSKFQDGNITCYIYYKSISCVENPQPAGSINTPLPSSKSGRNS